MSGPIRGARFFRTAIRARIKRFIRAKLANMYARPGFGFFIRATSPLPVISIR